MITKSIINLSKIETMKKILFTLAPVIMLLASCKSGAIREPEYRDMRDVRLIKVGLLQTTAGLNLVYYNPNKFGVQLKDATGKVYINDIYLGHFEMNETVKVHKTSDFVVPAIIKLDNLSAFANHNEIWNMKEANIRIDGLARLKKAGITTEVPIKYEGRQNIEKLKDIFSK